MAKIHIPFTYLQPIWHGCSQRTTAFKLLLHFTLDNYLSQTGQRWSGCCNLPCRSVFTRTLFSVQALAHLGCKTLLFCDRCLGICPAEATSGWHRGEGPRQGSPLLRVFLIARNLEGEELKNSGVQGLYR